MTKTNEEKKKAAMKGIFIAFTGVIATAIIGGTIVVYKVIRNNKDYVGKKATNFVQSYLGENETVLNAGEDLNYYEAINGDLIYIKDELLPKYDVVIPEIKEEVTLDQFKKSVINIETSFAYIKERGLYIEFSEQEMINFRNEMAYDYAIITKYSLTHKEEDYTTILNATFAHIIDKLNDKNAKDDVQISNITPINNDAIIINAIVNGKEESYVVKDQYYYNLITKVLKNSNGDYIEDLSSVTDAMISNTMISDKNEIVRKEAPVSKDVMLVMLIGMGLVIVFGNSMVEKKGKQKTNKK